MNATLASTAHQQKRINTYRDKADSYSFFNLVTSDGLFEKVEELLPEHRERIFPPTETLSMFLAQAMSADRSCQQAVNQAAIQKLGIGLASNSTHTGGYCRARKRLPIDMVRSLTRYLGEAIVQQVPSEWRWCGRRVLLADGTTVTMPDTPDNQAVFPQQRGQKPGLGFPICRIVGITCLASGALLNAAVGRFNGKGSGERGLLREIQDTFKAGDVLLGDAFYANYFFLATMQAKGVDILMEQNGQRKKSTDFRRGQKLGPRDHLIEISKPKARPDWMSEMQYAEAPASITIRECKIHGKILITTLCHKTTNKKALGQLYKSRWQVELHIRQIKDTMGMNILSCKTPEMAQKELWVYLLAYNLIRLQMAQSALLADISPACISFKHCLQIWYLSMQKIDTSDDQQLQMMFVLMAEQRVGKRPGRIEPRAVKRRPKAYPLLTRPRLESRQLVQENGHPKKLK